MHGGQLLVHGRLEATDDHVRPQDAQAPRGLTVDLVRYTPEAILVANVDEAHYRALLQEPERVHAVCEDYRAGATVDWQHDEADMAAGRKIACPTFLLWGSHYLGRGGAKPLDVWRTWCSSELSGAEIESGHFLMEENPEATLAALLPFLAAQRDMR